MWLTLTSRGGRARSKTVCAQCCFNRCLISLLAVEGCDFALLGWECSPFRPRPLLPEQPRANVASCSCLGFLSRLHPSSIISTLRLLDIKQFSPPLRIRALLCQPFFTPVPIGRLLATPPKPNRIEMTTTSGLHSLPGELFQQVIGHYAATAYADETWETREVCSTYIARNIGFGSLTVHRIVLRRD